jgi:hypothetical protein
MKSIRKYLMSASAGHMQYLVFEVKSELNQLSLSNGLSHTRTGTLNKMVILVPSPMGEKRNAYRILVGNPEEKRPLGRPRRRWVDNIKMDLRGIGGMVWIGLIWLRIGTGGGLL